MPIRLPTALPHTGAASYLQSKPFKVRVLDTEGWTCWVKEVKGKGAPPGDSEEAGKEAEQRLEGALGSSSWTENQEAPGRVMPTGAAKSCIPGGGVPGGFLDSPPEAHVHSGDGNEMRDGQTTPCRGSALHCGESRTQKNL
jgi:hypothetical protein